VSKNEKNKKNLIDKLVSVTILVLTLFFVICTVGLNLLGDMKKDDNNYASRYNSYTSVSVHFYDVTTTSDEYDKLKEYCNSYVKDDDTTIVLDNDIDTKEGYYIDNNGISTDNKDDTLYETGPIYFQDKMLMRYLNEKGEMKVVASEIIHKNEGDDEINTYNIDSMSSIFGAEQKKTSISENDIDENSINEDSYLKDLSEIFLEIINKSYDNIDSQLKIKAMHYFTEDGYNSIINNAKALNVKDRDISVNFIEAGKSSLEIDTKDRIIMQLKVNNKKNIVYTTIIIKLNDKQKIFDIDVI
jgi:hypothetical protein